MLFGLEKIPFSRHNQYFYPRAKPELPKRKFLFMRKFLIVFVMIIFSTPSLLAQEKKRTGFKIGVNYCFLRSEVLREKMNSDPKLGLNVSLFHEIPLGKLVTFQPEFAFNRFGGKSDNVRTNLDYISIPTLFKFHTKRFGFLLGPQLSLLINGEQKQEFQQPVDLKDELNSVDVSAVAGFEYSLGKNNRFVIAARYLFGVNNISKNSVAGNSLSNRSAQFTTGFRF